MNWGGFHTLNAAWLATLLVPVVLFYFLKLKRPRIEIPSLVLWRQVLQDHRVNSPFQRFKRNLLLLLQLLLLALLVLAAMQPYWRGSASGITRLPVLIDCSASMAALDKDGNTSRLTEAKRRVRQLIDGLARDQELSLVSFSNSAHKRTGFTNDKRVLREALDQIEIEDVPSDIEEVLRLTQALARSEPFDEVLLFSDGNFPTRAHFDLSFKLNYQRLPSAGPNAGITAFSARRAVDGGWDVFVQVEGSPDTSTSAEVALAQDNQSAGSERVTITQGRGQRLVFRVPGEKAMALRVELKPDGSDSLASDNVASLELPAARPLRVFVSNELATYRHALRAMAGIELAADGAFDLAISDRPEPIAPIRLLVGVVPADLQRLVTVGTNGTQVVDWRRDATLLQHVQLGDVQILDKPELPTGVTEGDLEKLGYEVLMHGYRGPLLVQKREGDDVTFALLFHTDRSTLPYRAGFPILVANAVQIALERAGLADAKARTTDSLARRVSSGVSLLCAAETTLVAADEIMFNEKIAVASAVAPLKTDRSLWWPFTLLAFCVLTGEWWYFQRRRGG